jgi:hypothetical protein
MPEGLYFSRLGKGTTGEEFGKDLFSTLLSAAFVDFSGRELDLLPGDGSRGPSRSGFPCASQAG